MGKSNYPTASELDAFLTEAGFTLGSLDTATAITAARVEFERRAGIRMLAGAATTLRFDPPTNGLGRLDFPGGLAELTSAAYQPEGGAAESWSEGIDFVLRPYDGGAEETGPFTAMELSRCWIAPIRFGDRRSIRVTGRWGYHTSIPEDAWLAMLARGASLTAAQQGAAISDGRSYSNSGGVDNAYPTDPLGAARKAWAGQFEAAIRRYRRLRL